MGPSRLQRRVKLIPLVAASEEPSNSCVLGNHIDKLRKPLVLHYVEKKEFVKNLSSRSNVSVLDFE